MSLTKRFYNSVGWGTTNAKKEAKKEVKKVEKKKKVPAKPKKDKPV